MNQRAEAARYDDRLRENFIRDSEQTILKIASKVSGKYISKSDDEWSVALYAFNKAIDSYSKEKGDFTAYAGVLIKRSMIDHYRSQKRFDQEIPASREIMSEEGEDDYNRSIATALARDSITGSEKRESQLSLKDEIIEVNEILKEYGFSFKDLKNCSPKAGKTKKECARAIAYVLNNEEALEAVMEYRRLPIKDITTVTQVKTKLLDRYRRYIIMAVVILNGEYPLLADYLKYVRKEGDG